MERYSIERPVGYFSKKLPPAERNYAITELECLAVVRAVEHFGVHLLDKTIHTGYKPLCPQSTEDIVKTERKSDEVGYGIAAL